MRLSDYEQHKMDEAYSAHMDSAEGERQRKAEQERLKAAAGSYVDNMLAHTSEPALTAKLLIADRPFLLSCMAGFACEEVTRALKALTVVAALVVIGATAAQAQNIYLDDPGTMGGAPLVYSAPWPTPSSVYTPLYVPPLPSVPQIQSPVPAPTQGPVFYPCTLPIGCGR